MTEIKDGAARSAEMREDAAESADTASTAMPDVSTGDGDASAAESETAHAAQDMPEAASVPCGTGPFGGKALGPIMQAIPMTADGESLVPTPPTVFSRIFTGLSFLPLVLPLLLLVIQVAFTLDNRSLWYSDEVRYADAYRNMVETGNWLVLSLNGNMYPDKPPLFFWFLRALESGAGEFVPGGLPQPLLFYTGVAISGLLCLLATHALAVFVARVDRRTVLAADLVLVSGFFFSGLLHYLRMDLMFAGVITLSHVLLFHAWMRERALALMLGGFLLGGLAVLIKGPLGLAFPLLAGVCFLAWQGRIGRLFRLDVFFGLLTGLAIPAVWLGMAWLDTGDAFVSNILHKQVLARSLNTWHHGAPWYHYLMTFPLIWLPWTLLFFFLPWGRLFGKAAREGLKRSRTPDGAGLAYLWCVFLPGVILLSAVSIKLPIYCLPLFPPLAILSARAILRMRPVAAAGLQYAMVLLLALLGIGFMVAPLVPEDVLRIPHLPKGTVILGGICLVFACALAFLAKPRRSEGMLLLMALFTTAFACPVWFIAAPSLDTFLSPRGQAEVVWEYRQAGYIPVAFKIYPGTYSYYAGAVPDFSTWEETLAAARAHPKALIALRASFWDKLADKPEGFAEVHRQTIAERDYVLVVRPSLGGEAAPVSAPASVPVPAQPDRSAPESAPAPETSIPEVRPQGTSMQEAFSAPVSPVEEAPVPSVPVAP